MNFINMILSTISISAILPILLMKLLGFTYFIDNEPTRYSLINNRLPNRSTQKLNGKKHGWTAGWPFIGFIGENDTWLITTKNFYNALLLIDAPKDFSDNSETLNEFKELRVIKKGSGCHKSSHFNERSCRVNILPLRPGQQKIADKILEIYKQKNFVSCFISGPPNAGKSMLPVQLALSLNAMYCSNYNPTKPGQFLENVISASDTCLNTPLVIVIEEFDVLLINLHNQKIETSPGVSTEVTDKNSFNTLMDTFNLGFYLHVILILTGNTPFEEIKKLDPSYIRPNRIDLLETL